MQQQNLTLRIAHLSKDHVFWLVVQIGKREKTYREIAMMFVEKFDMEEFAPGVPQDKIIDVVEKRCKHVARAHKDVLEAPPESPDPEGDGEPETEPPDDLDWVKECIRDARSEWRKLKRSGQLTPTKMNQLNRTLAVLEKQKEAILEKKSTEEWRSRADAFGLFGLNYDDGPRFSNLSRKAREYDDNGFELDSLNKHKSVDREGSPAAETQPDPTRNGEKADTPVQLPALPSLSASEDQQPLSKGSTCIVRHVAKGFRKFIEEIRKRRSAVPLSAPEFGVCPYNELTDEQMMDILMREVQGETPDSIAERVGCPVGVVIDLVTEANGGRVAGLESSDPAISASFDDGCLSVFRPSEPDEYPRSY